MQMSLMPDWMQTVAKFNPVNWAVEAGRSAAMQTRRLGPDPLAHGAAARPSSLVCGLFATRAFRTYQRSV